VRVFLLSLSLSLSFPSANYFSLLSRSVSSLSVLEMVKAFKEADFHGRKKSFIFGSSFSIFSLMTVRISSLD